LPPLGAPSIESSGWIVLEAIEAYLKSCNTKEGRKTFLKEIKIVIKDVKVYDEYL
jgi:hypothetical protein